MPERLTLFIDAQNTYRGARECFFGAGAESHTDGQFHLRAIADLIASRPPPGVERVVSEIRVYTGRPDSTRQPRAYAAHMRQCAAWERDGIVVVPRTLRYQWNQPEAPPREKGIDVQLAIDFVAGAFDGRYHAGVIFSTDTDLRPALEFVAERYQGVVRAESAAWRGPGSNRAIRAELPIRTWCHYLDASDYEGVRDSTDYNIARG